MKEPIGISSPNTVRPATMPVRKLTRLAMLTAISIVLLLAIRVPFPPAPFLEYDPADVPIFIAAFAYGPMAGLLITVVASLIQGLTVSAGGTWIGILMHILATGSYVLVAGSLYGRNKTKRSAVGALCVGTFVMTAVMMLCNLIFTPLFMGTPMDAVLKMMFPVILPFNLMKAGINSMITFLLYKSTERLLR